MAHLLRFLCARPNGGFGVGDPGFVKITVALSVPDGIGESMKKTMVDGGNVVAKRHRAAFATLVLEIAGVKMVASSPLGDMRFRHGLDVVFCPVGKVQLVLQPEGSRFSDEVRTVPSIGREAE